MPDIGLLQGAPRRRDAPPVPRADDEADAAAPMSGATPALVALSARTISVQVVSQATADGPPLAAVSGAAGQAAGGAPAAASTPARPVAPIRAGDLLWLALALLVIIGTGLGVRDPWPADEPRFAVIARDMVAGGEWLFPRVGADLYQDKPPLFFWMLAVCYALIGSVRWSFLLPSLLSAGGTLFLIYDFGRRLVSREAGLAAALITVATLQFVMTMRGAQIDPVLCGLTTLSLYALLRHLLLGPAWGWYCIGGFAAGLGVITKGVGFLPMLVLLPFFLMRGFHWQGLAKPQAGALGWRWWLAPLAMTLAISLWFIPMLVAVDQSGAREYAAYRDEILFKQTVGRYAAAWHHVKPWYYFIAEVVPVLWLPWSLLLVWLAPRFKAAFRERDARVWLPLSWLLLVLVFFSMSPGKRGVYIHIALPALALAALPFLKDLLGRPGVRRAGWVLALGFVGAAAVLAISHSLGVSYAVELVAAANLPNAAALYVYLLICAAGLALAYRRAPLAAWPVALGALAVVFSYWIAPAMNPERSASAFTRSVLAQVRPDETLALTAYKEQFLLYLDRPTVNFGHRRWLEGPQESYDAAAWLNAGEHRVVLVPATALEPCFPAGARAAGRSADEEWFLVRGPARADCAAQGDPARAIDYGAPVR